MPRRRKADREVPPIIVTTEDGTVFRCSLSAVGREREPRWVLLSASGEQFVGPPVETDKSPEHVAAQVSEWWASRQPRAVARQASTAGAPSGTTTPQPPPPG